MYKDSFPQLPCLKPIISTKIILFNLTPFIPLSFKGEGEEILERDFAPLLLTPLSLIKGGD